MKKRILKATMLVMAFAVMCMMSSCSDSKKQLLSSIPAENPLVVNFDGAKLLEALDTRVEDGKVSMPNGLVKRMELNKADAKSIENLGKFAENIDYNNIFFSLTPNKEYYITFMVKNQEGLINVLTADMDLNAINVEAPYKAYQKDGTAVLLKGDQAWIVPTSASEAVKFVISQGEKANKKNYTENAGIYNEFSSSNELLTGVWTIAENTNKLTPKYIMMNGGIKDNAIAMSAYVLDNEGDRLHLEEVGTINTDFLKYTTPEMDAFVAVCVDKNVDWDAILDPLVSEMGEVAAAAEFAKPYLKSIDGTVFMACKVPDNAELVGATGKAVPCIIQVPMNTEKANELTDQILQSNNIPKSVLNNNGSGLYSITAGGSSVYFGTYNGTLTFATVDPAQANGNGDSLKPLFEGKMLAASLKLPNLMSYLKGCNFGIDASASLDQGELTINVKLLGTQDPILLAIIYGLSDSFNN